MTAPNPTAVTDMTVPVATLGEHGALSLGFRQHWVEAESDGVDAALAAGAGLGSPYLTLSVERPGKPTIYETVDVRDFLPGWINAAIARAEAEESDDVDAILDQQTADVDADYRREQEAAG